MSQRQGNITLQQLEYFKTLAHYGNIGKAAAAIHISQPALSMSMKKLEGELGYALFDRTGSSISLNVNGTQFLGTVNSVFALLDSSRQRAFLDDDRYELWLGIIAPCTMIAQYCHEYAKTHPEVLIRFLGPSFLNSIPRMDRVDLLFSKNVSQLEGFTSLPLFISHDYAVFPRRFMPNKPESVTYADLARMPFVLTCAPNVAKPQILRRFLAEGVTPNVQFIADSRRDVLGVMKTGCYCTICPGQDVELYEFASPDLISAPIRASDDNAEYRDTIYVAWREGTISDRARSLLDYIVSAFDAQQD